MQPEYLIIAHIDIHDKLLTALKYAHIPSEKVLIVTPDHSSLPDFINQFAPDNQIIIDDVLHESFRKEDIQLREPIKIELQVPTVHTTRPLHREDPHPHIPKHLKRKYPRR